ncbi:hypothetical protein CSB20_13430 [bacterium DOLZORAL124_64_63]|nr:MAG: hypothetical protein CSB20_13430 [bacterium DOLZORAL124_64_63]
MSDETRNESRDDIHNEMHDDPIAEPPIEELADFGLPQDPEFSGRVQRSLNRHLLVGDALEFSLDIFQKTLWEYLKTAVEAWPGRNREPSE